MAGKYVTYYNSAHEIVDYGLCSNGEHNVLMKVGNLEDARTKDVSMTMNELRSLQALINEFLEGVEE